jgi:predicted O-methyltransferase YrrM
MVWRRLAQIEPLQMPMARAKERIEAVQFRLSARQRERLKAEYARCQTVSEYFDFSQRVFGPHQLEPEITGFLELARSEAPRTVCEIGTANGGTTFLLGQALPSTEILIGVDLFIRRRPRLGYFTRPNQKVVLLDGDSGAGRTLAQVRAALGGRPLDLLFIDGDHTLAGVARDFHAYRDLVRDGGLVAFHDIIEDSFTRTGVKTPHWTGGVPQFWRALKDAYQSHEFVVSSTQDGLGIGVIRYDHSITPPTF